MSQKEPSLLNQCIAEFIGTALLIMFGTGAVASLVLTGANFGQWEMSITWGMAVALAVYITGGVSGAHINPAVTLALASFAGFDKSKVIPFILSQLCGAFCAAALVYSLFAPLFVEWELAQNIIRGSEQSLASAGIFSTFAHPVLNVWQAFMVELVITAILMLGILGLTDDNNAGPNAMLTALLIGLLVAVIGACFGTLTGFAMNPARDFGPRVFSYFAGWGDIAMTGGRAIPYFVIPIVAPILGAQLGAFIYTRFIGQPLQGTQDAVTSLERRDLA